MPKIEAIALYELLGTRETVIAPCADAGVRPAEARENLLVIVTDDDLRGVANWADPDLDMHADEMRWLVGLDPRSLFRWDSSGAPVAAAEHAERLRRTSAIDLALLDLCAQIEQAPLWRILGPAVRDRVPAYASAVNFEDLLDPESTIDCVVHRAAAAVRCGNRAIKLKVGRGLRWMPWPECTERDVEVVRAVRAAVGPDVSLMLDGDRGYAGYVADAADFVAEVAPLRIEFVQDLVDECEVAELREALRGSGIEVPIAGGAEWSGRAACETRWPACPYDILQVDTSRAGMVEVVRAVRAAVGPDVSLMLDGDRGYAGYVADAADFVAEVAPLRIEFVQDLVDECEVAELREALRGSGIEVPIAGGAEWSGRAACETRWPACPYDILQVDTSRAGMVEQLATARFAEDNGLGIAPHNYGSRICVCAGVHLGAVAKPFRWCEDDDSHFEGYEARGYTLTDGCFAPPETPGLGILTFDPAEPAPQRAAGSRPLTLEAELI